MAFVVGAIFSVFGGVLLFPTGALLPALALLWRTAEVLGLEAAGEFRAAAEGAPGGDWLRDFTTRTPEDRSLEAMMFEEGSDDDGFRYIRNW